MPKFITIGYGDQQGYDRIDPRVRDEAHAHDARLVRRGMQGGIAGEPVTVRNPDGTGVVTQPGPFMHSELAVAGFGLIEAATLEEAVSLVSGTPCAVAHGVVEVWPLEE